jgi:hypothetical protein
MMCFGRPSCPCGQASRGRPLYPRNGTAALHFCAGVPVRLGPYRQQVPTPTGHLCDFTASLAPRKRATALTQRANAGRGGGAPSCRCCTCGKAEPQPFRRLKQKQGPRSAVRAQSVPAMARDTGLGSEAETGRDTGLGAKAETGRGEMAWLADIRLTFRGLKRQFGVNFPGHFTT